MNIFELLVLAIWSILLEEEEEEDRVVFCCLLLSVFARLLDVVTGEMVERELGGFALVFLSFFRDELTIFF